MNDLLKLHKVTGGRGTNEFIYKEYLDEHFNTGELNNVKAENDKLAVSRVHHKCILWLKGDDLNSISSNNVKITVDGKAPQIVEGKFNKALEFKQVDTELRYTLDSSFINNSDFTIDWWEYKYGLSNKMANIFGSTISSSGEGFNICYGNSDSSCINYHMDWSPSTAGWDVANRKIGNNLLNQWVHRAVVSQGKVLKSYENGKLIDTLDVSSRKLTVSDNFGMGDWRNQKDNNMNCKISNFRIHTIALWKGAFTPPQSEYEYPSDINIESYRVSPPFSLPNDIISSKINWDGEGRISIGKDAGVIQDTNTKLYLKGDEIKDISKYNNEIENPNNAIKVIEDSSKGCVYDFKEGANELKLGNPIDINEDWTIDYYIKFKKSVTSHTPILGNVGKEAFSTSTNICSLGFMEIGSSKFNYIFHTKKATGNWDKRLDALHALNINKWEHIAIVKKGWDVSVYVDGVSKGKLNLGADLKEVGKYFSIGTWRAETLKLPFNLSNLRFSDKALWESNFTPPLLTLKDTREFKECTKDARLNLDSNEILLKEELEGEETISNVQLDVKYKPKKEAIRPTDLVEDEDDSVLWLYKPGDECIDITSGWGERNSSYNITTPSYTRTSDYLKAHIICGNSNGHQCGFGTNKSIDLTGYSILKIDMSNYHTDEYNRRLVNVVSNGTAVAIIDSPAYENASRQIRSLDISSINTHCTIDIIAQTVWSGKQAEVVIYKVWLEK